MTAEEIQKSIRHIDDEDLVVNGQKLFNEVQAGRPGNNRRPRIVTPHYYTT